MEFLAPEAVKKLKARGDREGEAPAEPYGARICWRNGSPGLALPIFPQLPLGGGSAGFSTSESELTRN
ncbi:MAG: hypothetical protein DMG06_17935 [Acidobacteria bacterium]|nr:MAG: hypothetical protein DMG06_17935 [Acidobacteriota bacterium]